MARPAPAVLPPEPRTVAPSAVLTVPDRIKGIAGEATSFPIALDGTDAVPSRSVIVVKGLPQGSNFSEGRPFGDSEWTLKPDQIGDLHLAPPAGANGEFKLGIALMAPDDSVVAEAETLLEIAPPPAPAAPVMTEASSGAVPDVSEAIATAAIPDGGEPSAPAAAPDAANAENAVSGETPATLEAAASPSGDTPPETAEPTPESATAPSVDAPVDKGEQAEANKTGLGTVQPSVFVNLREAPSSSASVLGVVAKGAKLLVLDRKRGWVQVTDPASGKQGWIYSGLLAGEAKPDQRIRRVAPAEADSEPKSESFWGRVGRWLTPG